MSDPNDPSTPTDAPIRRHTFDGIQEYDNCMPRWWLMTLYGAIVFAVLYWGYYHAYQLGTPPEKTLEAEMAENTDRAARASGVINDETLWRMSADAAVIASGKATFQTTCAACHKPDLTGLIGPNLVDNQWIHGGKPMDCIKTINEGVLAKGMPAWGPLLGQQKITEVVSYIFSFHKHGEEIIAVPGWIPPGAQPPQAPAATT